MIARQRKNLARRQNFFSPAILHKHAICSDLHYARTEERLNLPCLDAVLDVRPHPIFYRRSQLFVPVHQRYTRAIAVQVERCFGRGIFPADDDYLLIPKFVRLGVVMRNVWQLFTRHSEFIRQIVISRGDRNFPAPIFLLRSLLRARHHGKVSVAALDPNHPFILPQLQPVVFRRFAVILQRFNARGLIRSANERQVSNLQQLRRGEEHHVHGVVEDGIAQASFVDDQRLHSRPLGLDSSRKARRPRSNANNVVDSHDISVCRVSCGIANRGEITTSALVRVTPSILAGKFPVRAGVPAWRQFPSSSKRKLRSRLSSISRSDCLPADTMEPREVSSRPRGPARAKRRTRRGARTMRFHRVGWRWGESPPRTAAPSSASAAARVPALV